MAFYRHLQPVSILFGQRGLELLLQYCRKSSRDACLVLIDLDHFKAVNDTHGHAVGDRVLQRAVAACKGCLRSTDIFGRLGGEEFGILLPECTLAQVLIVAEQIRLTIATASAGEDAPGVPISASFGISSTAHSSYELRQLLIHADEALRTQAKREEPQSGKRPRFLGMCLTG